MPHRGDAHQGLSFFVPFAPRAPRKWANKARRAVNKRGARVGEKEEEREECAAPALCEEDLDGEHKFKGSNVERKERAPTKHVIIELETVVQHQGFHCYISNKKFHTRAHENETTTHSPRIAPVEELRRRDGPDVRVLVVAQYEGLEVLDLQTRLREKCLQHLADTDDTEDSRTDWQVVLTDAL